MRLGKVWLLESEFIGEGEGRRDKAEVRITKKDKRPGNDDPI